MRAINISNDKARNAQVGFEVKKEKSDIVMARPDGMGYENARFLKSTIDTEPEDLLRQYGDAQALAQAILDGDPEIDMERVGMRLKGVRKIFLTEGDKIVYRINRQEVVYTPKAEEKEARPFKDTEANINVDIPLKWTGKLIPKEKAVRMFVFTKKYQVKHVNGLTYDFLYDMAKQLAEKNAVMLVGSGAKGIGPIVLSDGGTSYRAFLEGRIDGEKYCLILHLTNLELKALPTE